MNILDFQKMNNENRKISMVTCYDYWSAKIINESDVDCVLVGDSVAMVMHGYDSTIAATTEMIAFHTKAVRRGAPDKFIVADMPFLSFRKGELEAMNTVDTLMKAGANAVKLEGVHGHKQITEYIVESGVPVMGHIGLTPQSIHKLGGFRIQGKKDGDCEWFVDQARMLEEVGCFSLVLECIDSQIAKTVTEHIKIPTIGIGAGRDVAGQVLVLQDLLGMDSHFSPTFLRKYMNGEELLMNAINSFNQDVKKIRFPAEKESY